MARARGIDVSHHVPVFSFDDVIGSGVSFVFAKATEGKKFVDPKFRMHRDGLRQRPFVLGAYFHVANVGSAGDQARRLMDTVGELRDNERLALDLEANILPAPPTQTLQWMDEFFTTLVGGACSDRRPLLYASRRGWRAIGDPPKWDLASEIDLWAPRYNATSTEPELPLPWTKIGWTFWQWTDGGDTGPEHVTPGVGRCDANFFRGDEALLRAYAKLKAPVL